MVDILIYAGRQYERFGYGDRLRLLDGKRLAFTEEGPIDRVSREIQIRRHGFNLGMRLWDGLMVLDKDGENQGPFSSLTSPFTVLTSRGTHEYFRVEGDHENRLKVGGLDVDVLFHGTTVLPPSQHPTTDWIYRTKNGLVRKEELPFFPVELLKEYERPPPMRGVNILPVSDAIDRVRSYIGKIVAKSGAGGDRATFRAACRVVEAVQGDFDQAYALMLDWNETNAIPPWEPRAIEWKVRSAIKTVFGR